MWTVWTSLHRVKPLDLTVQGDAGFFNYSAVFRGGFWGSVGVALLLGAGPLVLMAIVAPLLAGAAHVAGTGARWVTRGLLALPLACFAPLPIALAWSVEHRHDFSGPDAAAALSAAVLLMVAGLVTGVGVTLFLAALRQRDRGRAPIAAVAVVWGLGVLTVLAVTLQQFTFPYAITHGGPRDATRTPVLMMVQQAYARYSLGTGAAVVTLIGILVGVLGLAATLLLVLTRARLEVDPAYRSAEQPTGWTAGRIVAAVLAGVGLLIVLVITLIGLLPWLRHAGNQGTLPDKISAGTVLAHTWVPPLISTVVGVGVALLAAVGIGVFRPFGRWSYLLLLPFGPWLFVGPALLALPTFGHGGSDSAAGALTRLIPPSLVTIPALFVLTLLLHGQQRRRIAAGLGATAGLAKTLVLPVLPMVALVGGVTWLVQAQDLFWSYSQVQDPKDGPAQLLLLVQFEQTFGIANRLSYGLVLPLAVVVVLFLAALALQWGYLDRVALRVGEDRPPADDPPSADGALRPAG